MAIDCRSRITGGGKRFAGRYPLRERHARAHGDTIQRPDKWRGARHECGPIRLCWSSIPFGYASSGTFFGAVVELDDANDFPDSFDFSAPDFLGATSLNFASPSDEVFGSLTLSLDPGWYALVFGSGLFGTNGNGGAVRNGTDLGQPTYIAAQPFSGVSNWVDITPELTNHRFVLRGYIVPEPSLTSLALSTCLFYLFKNRIREPISIKR
jgi:hypothetical protein